MFNQNPPRRIWNLNRTSGVSLNHTSMYEAQTAQQMAFIRAMMKEKRRQELFEIQLIEFEAVVFDLETTGFSPQNGDEIISIGAIAVKGKELLEHEKFYTMVNPNRNVPKHIEELTGISEEMVHEAPKLIEALTRFFEFVHRRTLIAHGTGHDKQFLNTALWKTSRVNLTNRVLDTMLIGKWLLPKLENYSLDHLLQVFGVGISNRHHALEDSVMTAQLWSKYMEELQARRITTLGDLYTKISMNTSFF